MTEDERKIFRDIYKELREMRFYLQSATDSFADSIGLFGNKKRPFSLKKLPGLTLVVFGIISMNLLGSNEVEKAPALFLIIATLLGACLIFV